MQCHRRVPLQEMVVHDFAHFGQSDITLWPCALNLIIKFRIMKVHYIHNESTKWFSLAQIKKQVLKNETGQSVVCKKINAFQESQAVRAFL